jgi:aminoglycoside phosphotransferase (APT) family kinase protein
MKIERLGGGITNRNFKLTAGGESFVLRIGGNDTSRLGIDRTMEHAASVNAAMLRLGPEVVDFLEPEGFLITRFVEGEPGRIDLEEALALLRRLHAGPPIPGRFDSFRVVEAYGELARPAKYDWAHELAGRIEARLGARPLVPCHNDLLPANFINDGTRLWLLDWEYAGMGDPAFDFANFAVNNGLPIVEDDPPEHVLMRFMSDFREAMWGAVQETLSELEFDFAAYTAEHFERLERTAAAPRFHDALG